MASAAVVKNVFVYGSLLAPEVLTALLSRVPTSAPALVQDFHRYNIRDRIYPAVLALKGSTVIGKVLFDISTREMQILNEFEDIDYHKEIVEPVLLDSKDGINSIAAPLLAGMYVWNNTEDKDLYGSWDYEIWREKHLEDFLDKFFPRHGSKNQMLREDDELP